MIEEMEAVVDTKVVAAVDTKAVVVDTEVAAKVETMTTAAEAIEEIEETEEEVDLIIEEVVAILLAKPKGLQFLQDNRFLSESTISNLGFKTLKILLKYTGIKLNGEALLLTTKTHKCKPKRASGTMSQCYLELFI